MAQMNVEDLQKELDKLEEDLQSYIKAREKIQELIVPLEARKKGLMAELELAKDQGEQVSAHLKKPPELFPTFTAPHYEKNGSNRLMRTDGARPAGILAALQNTKGMLEIVEQNLGQTFRTVDDIMNLLATINSYRGQIGRIVNSFSTLNRDADDSGTSGIVELAKNPILKNLTKELFTSFKRA